MAGSYPDVPNRRMAYDADGTVVLYRKLSTGAMTEASASVTRELNDEDETNITSGFPVQSSALQGTWHVVFIFPELRDLDGIFVGMQKTDATRITAIETSVDTTNGIDGTWTTQTATSQNQVYEKWRTTIQSESVTSTRAVRLTAYLDSSAFLTANFKAVHLYGDIGAGETPDRLLYIDTSTGLEYTGPIDWGNIPRGTIYDEDWYIKNNSSTLTANNTTINVESLYYGSGVFYTFSTGVGYSTSFGPISTIGASSRWPPSNSLVVRCDPPSTAYLGLHAARIIMNTSSWS